MDSRIDRPTASRCSILVGSALNPLERVSYLYTNEITYLWKRKLRCPLTLQHPTGPFSIDL